jgi:lysozyme
MQSSRAIVLGALLALEATSAALAKTPDHQRYPLRGIDVSHYQGDIDWAAVAGDHVSFAYVKATEGVEGRDTEFARNWRGARRAGVCVGAYHYFIFHRSARAQARNFLAAAPRRSSGLPPAVDLEPPEDGARLSGAEMRRELNAFLAIVEARYRQHAVLYVTPKFFATYRHDLPNRPMWRRSIQSRPTPDGSWMFWQYLSRGRISGIRTLVDLNVARTLIAVSTGG